MPVIGSIIRRIKNAKTDKLDKKKIEALGKSGNTIVKMVEKALTEGNYTYFLYFGSLLGIVRSGKFIEFDNDVDYGIIVDDGFSWDILEEDMGKHGMKKVRQFSFDGKITEQTYQYGDLTVDLFACYLDDDSMQSYIYFRKDRYIYNSQFEFHVASVRYCKVQSVKKVTVNDMTYSLPENAEELLACIYSDAWRVPDPNWNHATWKAWHELENTIALIEYPNK